MKGKKPTTIAAAYRFGYYANSDTWKAHQSSAELRGAILAGDGFKNLKAYQSRTETRTITVMFFYGDHRDNTQLDIALSVYPEVESE